MTTPTAPKNRWLPVVIVLAGIVAIGAFLEFGEAWHEDKVARRTDGMAAVSALVAQYSRRPDVGAGELVMKVCGARDYARSQAVKMDVGDPEKAGLDNAVAMTSVVMGLPDQQRDVAEQVTRTALEVCDTTG